MADPPITSVAQPHRGGPELRLERGAVYVALAPVALAPGIDLVALSMEVPGVRLPFDVAAGAAQFHGRTCELDHVELSVTSEALRAFVAPLALTASGLACLDLAARAGFLEGTGALADGAPFTFKAALIAPEAGAGVALRLYSPRIYAPSSIPAAALPALVARALRPLAVADPDDAKLRLDPLPLLLRRALPASGFALPRAAAVRLARADVEPGRLLLVWDRGAAAPVLSDSGLLLDQEGAPGARADLAEVCAARREPGPASQALAAAAEAAACRGEESAALASAEACFRLGPRGDPTAQASAAEVALRLQRDHLPALRTLVELGERRQDRDALLRACRRLAAYAPDADEKAAAHTRLGALLAADPPAARLHLDHALRLARSPESLRALAKTCEEMGEHARAERALERLRDVPPLPALSPGGGEGSGREGLPPLSPCAPRVSSPSPREAGRGPGRGAGSSTATANLSVRPERSAANAARSRRATAIATPTATEPPTSIPPALAEALARARAAPLDPAVLEVLAKHAASAAPWSGSAERRRLELLARTAGSLAAFAAGGERPDEDAAPRDTTPALRATAAHPFSRGALPRLLALLAPALEALYQGDLAHRGVSAGDALRACEGIPGPSQASETRAARGATTEHSHGLCEGGATKRCDADRSTRRWEGISLQALSPARGPQLMALLTGARRALDSRNCAAYLRAGDGFEVELENTRPPSLVLGGGLARAPAPAARFLLARGLALVDLGWAVAGRLGPEARASLCELACRFAGGAVARPALPPARAEALLGALARDVPVGVRDEAAALGAAAASELATTPQPRLAAAARRTASRLALLHAGAPGAALAALVASERPLRERARADALAHGDVRDLASFALSDTWLDLRAERT